MDDELYDWDEPTKRLKNLKKHGVDFNIVVEGFSWDSAQISPDLREDYGEDRFIAYGFIGADLYAMVFTPRDERIRLISLRKASKYETRKYVYKN